MSTVALTPMFIRNLAATRARARPSGATLRVRPGIVAAALALSMTFVLGAGATIAVLRVGLGHDHLWGFSRLFELNGEANLPAWFSSALLLSAAAVLIALAAAGTRVEKQRWGVLAGAFVMLSLDEMASLHERMNAPLRALLQGGPWFYFPWVLGGVGGAVALLVFEWPLLKRLSAAPRRLVLASGIVYLAGAAGFETLAAPLYATGAKASPLHALLVTCEEALEMAGVALFIVALLCHARAARISLSIRFDDRHGAHEEGCRTLAPRECTRALVWIVVLLAAASATLQTLLHQYGIVELRSLGHLMNVSREGNLPTWYQASALLTCGALAGIAARAEFDRGGTFRWHWTAAAALFLYLAVDEAAAIHEMSGAPLGAALHARGLLYPRITLGAAAALVIVLAARGFVSSLPGRTRRGLLLAVAIFLSGALGVEAFGGRHAEMFGRENLGYALLTTVEEALEMFGVVLMIRVLMEYVRDAVGHVTVLARVSGQGAG